MPERFEVGIVGVGLFGAALAHYLAADGRQRVVAFDASDGSDRPSGTEASAGILSVQAWDPWDVALVRESAAAFRELAEREGVPRPRVNGGVRVARTEEGSRWIDRVRVALEREGVDAAAVVGGALRDVVPFADLEDVRAAVFTPGDSVVDPVALRAAFRRSAERRGAVIVSRPFRPAPAASHRAGRPLESGHEVVADRWVIAAGGATKGLMEALGAPVPLAPFRAQVARYRPRRLLAPFPTLHDLDYGMYLAPAANGRLVAGDGTGAREADPRAWDPGADPAFLAAAATAVGELAAELAPWRLDAAWSGLCVASPDPFPLVGPAPGASGIVVASGFNGFGTMRAPALARRLAVALGTGDWRPLAPADPSRFGGPVAPFDPRPLFPLELDPADPRTAARDPGDPAVGPAARPDARPPLEFRRLSELREVERLTWTPLSEWFDPFLPLFARDTLRTGGSVEIAVSGGSVCGLLLSGSSEEVGSGFTRIRSVARRYLDRRDAGGIYLEEPWTDGGEPVEVFAADLRDWASEVPLRHPVRMAQEADLPAIRRLMRAELGPGVDGWIATLPRPEETAFVGEVHGDIVGVSWLSRVGPFARGHSFVVHPRYRGLGLGTDLLTARMLWLQRTGGRQVVSEIYDGNAASMVAAERAGMSRVARLYHFRPAPVANGR